VDVVLEQLQHVTVVARGMPELPLLTTLPCAFEVAAEALLTPGPLSDLS
jgi:hypothetical protein